MTTSW